MMCENDDYMPDASSEVEEEMPSPTTPFARFESPVLEPSILGSLSMSRPEFQDHVSVTDFRSSGAHGQGVCVMGQPQGMGQVAQVRGVQGVQCVPMWVPITSLAMPMQTGMMEAPAYAYPRTAPSPDVKLGYPPAPCERSSPTQPCSVPTDTEDAPLDEGKAMLARYIYELMQEKKFTSPHGHLLMDVYQEVWRGIAGERDSGSRSALERFAKFLDSSPKLFETFHLGVLPRRGRPQGRAGEMMVRLVR